MKTRSFFGLFAAAALWSSPFGASAGEPAPKENTSKSETRNVKGHPVTIRAEVHHSLCVVLVDIAAAGIKYGDMAVTAFNKEGQEIALRPDSPNGLPYPSTNPGGPVGIYAAVLRSKEQLATVKVTWGEENQTFNLLPVAKKP